MIHHERLMPPPHDCPADEWNVIEKAFHPEFLAQFETMLALGNGYLGMRGCPEEGGPNAENGTFINGFYETRPIVYGEEAYAENFQRVIDSQNKLLAEMNRLAETRSSIATNLIAVYKALGGGWEVAEGKAIVSEALQACTRRSNSRPRSGGILRL